MAALLQLLGAAIQYAMICCGFQLAALELVMGDFSDILRVQKGDKAGHPFYGNQHTGGGGGSSSDLWNNAADASNAADAASATAEASGSKADHEAARDAHQAAMTAQEEAAVNTKDEWSKGMHSAASTGHQKQAEYHDALANGKPGKSIYTFGPSAPKSKSMFEGVL